MKKKRIMGILLAAVLAVSFTAGCSVGNTQIKIEQGKLRNHRTVFKVNDDKCNIKQAKLYFCNYRNLYGNVYGAKLWEKEDGNKDLETYAKDVAIQELTRITCMKLLAKEKEISLTEKEKTQVDAAAKEYYDSLTKEEKSYMGIHKGDIRDAYNDYALADKLYQSMTKGTDEEVSDDEARVIRVQQIYVKDKDIAKEVQKRLSGESDFAGVAGTYSEKKETERTVARGDFPQEVENIAFNLNDGECSEMIQTEDGYYFVKCLNKNEKELTEKNKEKIRDKRENEQFNDCYQKFMKEAKFQLNDKLWNQVTLEDVDGITTDSFFRVYDKYFKQISA